MSNQPAREITESNGPFLIRTILFVTGQQTSTITVLRSSATITGLAQIVRSVYRTYPNTTIKIEIDPRLMNPNLEMTIGVAIKQPDQPPMVIPYNTE